VKGQPVTFGASAVRATDRPVPARSPDRMVEWTTVGGGPTNARFSALTDINRNNVNQLSVAWRWRPEERPLTEYGTVPGNFTSTPIMIDNVVYVSTNYNSVVALDADTGAYKWHYQETPGESWDFTATQPIMLATLKIDGQDRKVLMQAPKNGFFYVVDRTTGKLISARNFVPQNWATGVDMTTGRPIENPEARYPDGKPFAMCPSALGGHSWHPMAFSPKTGLVYLPTYQVVMVYGDDPNFKFTPGIWNNAISTKLQVAPDDPKELAKGTASFAGRLVAWDPVAQKPAWTVQHSSLQNGGVLATAGGLIFEGTGAGRFEARDAADGKLLRLKP